MKHVLKSLSMAYFKSERVISHWFNVAVTIFFLCGSHDTLSQFNLGHEMNKLVKIPQSPEAAAFTAYGDHQISLYTGTPNISIPIYAHRGLESAYSVALAYDATGVKVESLSSQVGLNWSLMAGGMITRIVKGLPDTNIDSAPAYLSPLYDSDLHDDMLEYLADHTNFETPQGAIDFLDFKLNTGEGFYEMNWDLYNVSTPFGLNTKIAFDPNTLEPISLSDPLIKIEVVQSELVQGKAIERWTITDKNGATYYFNKTEKTQVLSDPETNFYNMQSVRYGASREYNSGWYLTKYESPNRQDVYEFFYDEQPQWLQYYPASVVEASTFTTPDNNPADNNYGLLNHSSSAVDYHISEKTLKEIKHNGKKILSIVLKDRLDHRLNTAIDRINIHNWEAESIDKYYQLDHSYFGDPGSLSIFDKRLKLDGLTCYTESGEKCDTYKFNYLEPDGLPCRISKAQDYLGYYNGKDNNPVLYPKVTSGNDTYDGANRDPDFEYAVRGMLSSITYPTGGYTEFEWESDRSPITQKDIVSGSKEIQVTMGSLLVLGGTDPSVTCNNACLDLYQAGYAVPPKVESTVFNLEGGYHVEYAFSGEPIDQFGSDAYLFYLGPTVGNKTHAAVSYEQLIDDQGNFLKPLVWSNVDGDGPLGSIDAGSYQLVVVNGVTGTTTNARVYETITQNFTNGVVGTGSVRRAGIRIKKVIVYAEKDSIAKTKKYLYSTSIEDTLSSGNILYNPVLKYNKLSRTLGQHNEQDPSESIGLQNVQLVVRTSYSAGASGPHVGYEHVYEVTTDEDGGTPLGYTENNFNVGYSGSRSLYTPYTVDYYTVDSEAGKMSGTITYNNENEGLVEQKTEYQGNTFFVGKGVIMTKHEENSYKFPVIVPNGGGSDGVHIQYHDARTESISMSDLEGVDYPFSTQYLGETDGGQGVYVANGPQFFASQFVNAGILTANLPTICNDPENVCYNNMEVSTWVYAEPSIEGEIELIQRTQSYQYFDGDTLAVYNENFYDPLIGHLLRETQTVNSNGDTTKVIIYYPQDALVAGSAELIQKNNLVEQVRTESYLNGELLSSRSADYRQVSDGVVVPDTIRMAKGNQSLEIMAIIEYDDDGRIKESRRPDGVSSVYIWGYNKTQVIAKLEGIPHASVDPVDIANLELLSDQDVDNLSEQTLQDALNQLVTDYPEAMVTGFTYDPLIGVTGMMDARGRWGYFEYDENNRLQHIKDNDLNLLKSYEYNYAQVFDPLSIELIQSSYSNTNQNFGVNIVGGSGDYSYSWQPGNGSSDTDFLSEDGTLSTYQMAVDCGEVRYVKVTVTDNGTGEQLTEIEVNNIPCTNPPLQADIVLNMVKFGSAHFLGSQVEGGSGNYTYEWRAGIGEAFSFPIDPDGTGPGFMLNVPCDSDRWVKLTITDDEGTVKIVTKKYTNSTNCEGGGDGPIE